MFIEDDQTLSFYDFPAEHWRHIRSTNVIESTFSTVRLRTYKTKGCCNETSILTMVFKLVELASRRWQKLHSSNIIPFVLEGFEYRDGVAVVGVAGVSAASGVSEVTELKAAA